MKKYKVYKITNLLNSKIYIGYTGLELNERFRCHKNSKDTSMIIVSAIKKYGHENFLIEEISSFNTKDEATEFEIEMIAKYHPEYNIHPGGMGGAMFGAMNPMYGKTHSEEWKECKSISMKGDKNPMYGRTHTAETKALLSEMKSGTIPWNKNKKNIYSKETLAKMSLPKPKEHKEKLSRTYTFINPKNEVVCFTGLLSFCKENDLNAGAMSEVYNGKRPHHKNWKKYD